MSATPFDEAATLQEEYKRLVDEGKMTKKALCELCIPFRDKYRLTDQQVLRIARKETDLLEMCNMLFTPEE